MINQVPRHEMVKTGNWLELIKSIIKAVGNMTIIIVS
jgi:hypothetical protein